MAQELHDFSQTIGTDPVEVHGDLHPLITYGHPKATSGLMHMRVWNVGDVTIWLSRSGAAKAKAPGSFPLKAGEKEEFEGEAIPLQPLSAVAEAEGGVVTVELRARSSTAIRIG